jgi:hypothetical protein
LGKTGIYALEFVGGGIVSVSFAVGTFAYFIIPAAPPNRPLLIGIGYGFLRMAGDVLLTAPATWGIGRLLKQKGSLWKTMIGAGIGSILGTSIALTYLIIPAKSDGGYYSMFNSLRIVIMAALPPLGAVIGYNL